MDFTRLENYLKNVDKNMVPSLRCIVKKGNDTVFEYFDARQDVYESEKEKELYYLFSATKVITCSAVMRLHEEGKLSIDDPVYKYLPEFKELYIGGSWQRTHMCIDQTMPKAKNTLLIKHLMSMTGGYTYDLGHPEIQKVKEETNNNATTREIVRAIGKMPILFEPGENFNYSLCHDILAAIVEVVTGISFFEYLDKIIFTPLGMKDTFFLPTEEQLKRMHNQYMVRPGFFIAMEQAPVCIYATTNKHESGGAGLVSTISDYAKFASCLATGTSKDGYRLLKKETVDLMRTPQLCEKAQATYEAGRPGYSYGLGVRTHVDPSKSGGLAPVGEFGWDGAAGAFTVIDPDNKISIVYTQHVLACGYCYSHIHQTVRNLVYEAFNKGE